MMFETSHVHEFFSSKNSFVEINWFLQSTA